MKQKNAFTLVEMLIVIAIVAILAFVAVSSFGIARQQARRDIAIDSLVSELRAQQGVAKSGRLSEEQKNVCSGMLFLTEDPFVQVLEMPYVAVGETAADYCDITSRRVIDFQPIEDFEVKSIDRFGNESDDFLVLFKPPFARIVMSDATFSSPEPVGVQTDPSVIVRIGLANDDEIRAFRLDTSSGLIERINEQNDESS